MADKSKGFTICPDEIMRIKTGRNGITQTQKLLYCRLLRFTENKQAAFPSNAFLAQEFGVTPRNIIDAKNSLELIGVIKQTQRYNNSNMYEVFPWTDETPTPKQIREARGENFAPPIEAENEPENCENVGEGVKTLHGRGENFSLPPENFAPPGVKTLHTNKQDNKQLNLQLNKQEIESPFDDVPIVIEEKIEETPRLRSHNESYYVSSSSPSLLSDKPFTFNDIPKSWLMGNLKRFKTKAEFVEGYLASSMI